MTNESSPIAMNAPPLEGMEELLKDYAHDAVELVQNLEAGLMALENAPGDTELIHACFRDLHTLKGDAGAMQIFRIEKLAHLAEDLLFPFRSTGRPVLAGIPAVLLLAVDTIKALLRDPAELYGKTTPDEERLLAILEEQNASLEAETASNGEPPAPAAPGQTFPLPGETPAQDFSFATAAPRPTAEPTMPVPSPAAAPVPPLPAPEHDLLAQAATAETSVRVSTRRLDKLIESVGELLVVRGMVVQSPQIAQSTDPLLQQNMGQLSKISRDLQELSNALRLTNLKGLFQKLNRAVRDLAAHRGAPINFVTSGEDAEMDRHLAAAIAAPLLHLIRNAVDHGIEPPEERTAQGKPPAATITLHAWHENGQVHLRVSDDGRGLQREAIVAKAEAQGLVRPGQQLTPQEIDQMIFLPGFSTKAAITAISGRGVGMDVVKREVQGLRGRIRLASTPGQGTSVTLSLPLTLAILGAMTIQAGKETYLIPTEAVHETFQVTREQVFTVAGQGEAVLLRGIIHPLVRLHELFDIPGANTSLEKALCLLVQTQDRPFALLVDAVLGQQQVVLKSLGPVFSGLQGISGGAILGSGRVALILDPLRLTEVIHATFAAQQHKAAGF